ncbi:MAG: GNAT family N-acetyltransferase [Candidatus Marinimicrobia bacterium]|jgi:ribosomal protein S18 acetylase RimI-like enzyme|nr:GNAT family N-acetyltransferase [Candidatus Neomarinimicrobiota bacterium]MDP6593771.1 GNAT family N-acetyltransferase [Candidatus Neomarinimicrobiota bacterium]MDP6835663.1 GNAT family N-acetyltransferase [Candidatus Neomarinimicrobiota bacterium]|tara:strand:- start:856 stop:1344 length:489 start_codon:yes stop_codon:yes gene_type:complete
MITIRNATEADIAIIVAFNSALAEESENRSLEPKILKSGVTQFLQQPQQGFYTLAEVDGEIVGQVMITTEFTDWRNGVMWWIQSVYVKPKYRRQGIYRALHEYLAELAAKKEEVRGIRVYVHDENKLAQQVYLNLGMEWSGFKIMEKDFVLPPVGSTNKSAD